jgi:hypothetical protein
MLRYIAHLSVLASSERFKDFVLPYKWLDRVAGASPGEKSEPRVPLRLCFLFSVWHDEHLFTTTTRNGNGWALPWPGAWERVLSPSF